jgi:hypothetical protein
MLSFELTAIDLILVIAVIVLLILYMTKLANSPEQFLNRSRRKYASRERVESGSQGSYGECPRGFGNIKKIGNDGSVSERCLGCYRIMECYGESEKSELQANRV